jgi:hypothetical protein
MPGLDDPQNLFPRTCHGSELVCILCSRPIVDGTSAPTTDGFHVHIRCADAQAVQAFAKRQRYALIHAWGWGLVIWGWIVGGSHWILAAVVAGAVLHPILHHCWWRIVFRLRWKVRGQRTED